MGRNDFQKLGDLTHEEMTYHGLQIGPQWFHLQGFYGACLVVNAPGDSKSCDIHLSFPPSITLDKAEQVKAEFMAEYKQALENT